MTRANAEGPFRVDLESFPLMRMGSPNVAQYDHPSAQSFFDCIEQALARDEPFVILHDARGVPHADEIRRQDFMRLLEIHRPRIERLVVAYAAICGSPLERGLITAFMWFIRVPLPIRIFGNEVEAKAWLLSRLLDVRKQKSDVPEPARAPELGAPSSEGKREPVEARGSAREQSVEARGQRNEHGHDPHARDSGIIYSSRRSNAS